MAEQMMSGHNVNVKQSFKNNVIERNQVDVIADRLVDKLGNADYRTFYCKVANKLPQNIIESNLEQALKGNSPAKYFSWLCTRAMR